MKPMSPDEVVTFMREGSRTGKLAVTRLDGRPHVSPVLFDFDWASETCRRYVGHGRADEFGRRNAARGEILVRVAPSRYVGAFGMSD